MAMVKTPPPKSRRGFLTKLWIGLGIAAFLQILAATTLSLLSGRKRSTTDQDQIIEVGQLSDFPPGSVTFIAHGHLYLCHLNDGGFLAISRKCTHLGCAVPWIAERKQFECPCHASVFDITGSVLKSPAPRALDIYAISFKRNQVTINIGNPIRRTTFNTEQLAHPQGRS